MGNFNFYGVSIPYDGRPLGIYKSRDPESVASRMMPEYAECDIFTLERQATKVSREEFLVSLGELRELAADQANGNVGVAGPLFVPCNLDNHRQSLANTRAFCDLVLAALGGK